MSDADNFTNQTITTHGGLSKFESVTRIDVSLSFSGAVLEVKGYPGTRRPNITIFPQAHKSSLTSEAWVTITNLSGNSSDVWHFTPTRVWITSSDGKVLQERYDPRSAFKDQTIMSPWDDLHLLYFFSYAMYNYLSVPFSLSYPGFKGKDIGTHKEFSQIWRAIEVTHPADKNEWPTHIETQKFYFGENDKLLKRMDYVTELFGGVASHYVSDYKDFGGLLIPVVRRVVSRIAKEPGTYSAEDVPLLTNRSGFLLIYEYVKVHFEDGTEVDRGKRVN